MNIAQKRSLAEMQEWTYPFHENLAKNIAAFETNVLELQDNETEDSLDASLALRAQTLGLGENIMGDQSGQGHGTRRSRVSMSTVISKDESSGSLSAASRSTAVTSPSMQDLSSSDQGRTSMQTSTSQKSLSFSIYENFLEQGVSDKTSRPPFKTRLPALNLAERDPSILSATTTRTFSGVRKSVRRWSTFQRGKHAVQINRYCSMCHSALSQASSPVKLACSHEYCSQCLHSLVEQATACESTMPPSCCGTVIPGTLIKDLLTPLEQQRFLETVLEYAVASGNQFVCTNLTCGNLIPRNSNLDPKNPFELACQQCGERICKQCSQEKHSTGDSCPFDWEVDALRQLGDDSVWRRCYRCANLVKLDPDSTHMSCSCDAKYCYLCGGIWDPVSGCPNSCNYDEDIQRRREAREEMKEREAKAAIERDMANAGSVLKALEATSRSAENEELQDLRSSHYEILDRFVSFEQKQKWLLWTRHGKMKSIMLVRQAISEAELKEQHKTAMTSLEDRQVAAEMDLRQTFLQERRACAVRLRHMEAYCSGYSAKNAVPPRVVTDRDLRELHQQYRVRDGMDQAHENRINVLREKQAQRLEALEARQMDELERLKQRSALELEAMSAAFASEEDHFKKVFDDRRSRLLSRWKLVDAIARKQLELETGLAYGPLSPIQWPNDIEKDESLTKEVGQGPLGTTTTPTRRSRRPTGARSRTAPPLRPSIDNFMLPASSPGLQHEHKHLERSFLNV